MRIAPHRLAATDANRERSRFPAGPVERGLRHLRALAGVRLSAMLGGTSQKGPHAYHNGLLRVSVNEESMTLKLTLIRSFSLTFISTECSR